MQKAAATGGGGAVAIEFASPGDANEGYDVVAGDPLISLELASSGDRVVVHVHGRDGLEGVDRTQLQRRIERAVATRPLWLSILGIEAIPRRFFSEGRPLPSLATQLRRAGFQNDLERLGFYLRAASNLTPADAYAVAFQLRVQAHPTWLPPGRVQVSATATAAAAALPGDECLSRADGSARDLVYQGPASAAEMARRRHVRPPGIAIGMSVLCSPLLSAAAGTMLSPVSSLYLEVLWPRARRLLPVALVEEVGELPSSGRSFSGLDADAHTPLVRGETLVHVVIHVMLLALGIILRPSDEMLVDGLHPVRLGVLSDEEELSVAIAAGLAWATDLTLLPFL